MVGIRGFFRRGRETLYCLAFQENSPKKLANIAFQSTYQEILTNVAFQANKRGILAGVAFGEHPGAKPSLARGTGEG